MQRAPETDRYVEWLFANWAWLRQRWHTAGLVPSLTFALARASDLYPNAAMDDEARHAIADEDEDAALDALVAKS